MAAPRGTATGAMEPPSRAQFVAGSENLPDPFVSSGEETPRAAAGECVTGGGSIEWKSLGVDTGRSQTIICSRLLDQRCALLFPHQAPRSSLASTNNPLSCKVSLLTILATCRPTCVWRLAFAQTSPTLNCAVRTTLLILSQIFLLSQWVESSLPCKLCKSPMTISLLPCSVLSASMSTMTILTLT
jgi:hypothetical protein